MKNLLIIIALITLFSCKKENTNPKQPSYTNLCILVYTPDSLMAIGNARVWRNEQHYKDYMSNGKLNDLGYYISPTPPLYVGSIPLNINSLPANTYYIEARDSGGKYKDIYVYYTYTAQPYDTTFKLYLVKKQ